MKQTSKKKHGAAFKAKVALAAIKRDRRPAPVSEEDCMIMALIDRQYLVRPYHGSRRMTA